MHLTFVDASAASPRFARFHPGILLATAGTALLATAGTALLAMVDLRSLPAARRRRRYGP